LVAALHLAYFGVSTFWYDVRKDGGGGGGGVCNPSGLGWLACEYQIYREIVYCIIVDCFLQIREIDVGEGWGLHTPLNGYWRCVFK